MDAAVPTPDDDADPGTDPGTDPGSGPGALPERVWDRLVALTAEVLPELDPVPPSLRRVADFAPQRRARLGATAISLALTRDDDLRGRVAEQVRAGRDPAGLVAAVTDDAVPAAADPAEVAALTWLLRPEGWSERLARLLDRLTERTERRRQADDEAEVTRLRNALDGVEVTQREERSRLRAQIDTLKTENAGLRRRLGEARTEARAAREEADRAQQGAAGRVDSAQAEVATAEAETRRLRARVTQLEEVVGASRREVRASREDAALRTRLLLDALLEAGQGLRRELGLPAAAAGAAPAERLEEELAAAGRTGPESAVTGAPVSALQLQGWLQMPRSRLLIDGYNVSKTAWPDSSLDVQRTRLLADVAALVSRTGAETTVVFDAASTTSRGSVNPPRGVKVVFSPPGVIADDVLRDLVAVEPAGRTVVVVSSDQAVMRDVRRGGAKAVPSPVLLELLGH